MLSTKKNLFSFCAVIAFVILALASKVNQIHYGAFNYSNRVEDRTENKNYLVKNDGTKIYGESISWKTGLLVKDQIKIDDQKFKISEILGYRNGDTFIHLAILRAISTCASSRKVSVALSRAT